MPPCLLQALTLCLVLKASLLSTCIIDYASLTLKLRLGEVRWPAQEHMAVRDKSELSLCNAVSTHDQTTEGGNREMQDKSKCHRHFVFLDGKMLEKNGKISGDESTPKKLYLKR